MTKIEVMSIKGKIDRTLKNALHGWIWDANHPTEPLVAQVSIDGAVIGSVKANRSRKDLLRAGIGSGAHAFELPLPLQLCDGRTHQVTLEAVAADGRAILVDARTVLLEGQLPSQTIRGRLEGLRDGKIIGWVWDEQHPTSRVPVELHVNGVVVAKVAADRKRSDLVKANIGDGRHAFQVALSSIPMDVSKPAEVHIAVQTAEGSALLGSILLPDGTLSLGTVSSSRGSRAQTDPTDKLARSDEKSSDDTPAEKKTQPELAAPASQKIDWKVLASRFFDAEWYADQAPDGVGGSKAPFDHWWNHGRHKGLSPHRLFDHAFYAKQVGDKSIQNKDLFLHFLHNGHRIDADPHPCFSMAWYRSRYETRDHQHPWIDYLLNGQNGAREPNWLFSHSLVARLFDLGSNTQRTPLETYLAQHSGSAQSPHPLLDLTLVVRHNKDVDASRAYETFWTAYRGREIRTHLYFDPRYYLRQVTGRATTFRALADYILHGEKDGLLPIPLFHPDWYKGHYGSPERHNSALEEFADTGEKLQRHPCPGFDPRYYLERHADVARARQAPLRHFITSGQREGRRPHPRFDLKWYAEQIPAEAKEKAFEYFLETGRAAGHAPHPAVQVEPRGRASEALTAFLEPNPSRSTVVPGIQTVFTEGNTPPHNGILPPVNGQAWLVDRFEREAHAGTTFTANRAKRWEPIARQYAVFNETAAEKYARDIDAQFGPSERPLPLVSVIMPTRNRASVLKRAIRSVLSQTHANLELIVVDDGSTDGTEKLLRTHIPDPRVVYIPIAASGVSAARNEGIRRARGEYIAYLDSDNYWEPRHLEITLKAMILKQAAAAYSTLRVFNAAGTVVYRGDVFNLDALRRENYIDMNVYVHHRRFVDDGIAFDENLRRCVDWDLILRISKIADPLFVPVIGCNYVDDNDTLERITTSELSGDFYKVCQRNINLDPHIVGTAPAGECSVSIVWPISNADWAAITDDLWAAVRHVVESGHELIIVNNALTFAATNLLNALARQTRHVRVINLWRSFQEYPAANLAASIAKGHHLLVWRSGVTYEASAVDDFVRVAGQRPSALALPLVVDPATVVVNELARLDLTSALLLPTLTGQSDLPRAGQIHGIIPVTSPVLIHAQTFRELGGFEADFAVTYGLADFAARLLSADPRATVVHLDTRLSANKKLSPASSQNEYLKELDALKERWLGKLRIEPSLPEGFALRDPRKRPTSVVNWNLLPDTHSGSALVAPAVSRPLVFALRCPAPNSPEKDSWGDYHYAQSIIAALEDYGHSGVIEFRDDWSEESSAGDVVLHIRGIVDVKPVKSALNAMWVISHPDKIRPDEYAAMDAVFAAGYQLKAHLWQVLGVDSHLLLQATDPARFCVDRVRPVDAVSGKVLFVGNSRLQPRTIVLDSVQQGLPLVVYGKDWDPFLPSHYVRGEYIPNEDLGNWYGSAAVVLNDHWLTMREYGIISNRIFDVVAAGRPVITDFVEGLDQIFGDAVRTYSDSSKLPALVEGLRGFDGSKVSRHVREKHSFKARTAEILDHLNISKR
ncbi:glycosyltransferase [Microvirga soli]|uniref:glycosyltransferase n=1 Tax=Microvirga soli TaxID=1854496 RepID=UPI0019200EFF|nr:glycosyltransferase [Microvirga soli]